MKKIGIIGCGWLGTRVGKYLHEVGHTIVVSNTQQANATEGFDAYTIRFSMTDYMDFKQTYTHEKQVFDEMDVLLISVPVSKRNEATPLHYLFTNLTRFVEGAKAKQVFFFSTTGIYPSVEAVISETSIADTALISRHSDIERLLQKAIPSLVILRLGGLFGDERVFRKYYLNGLMQSLDSPVNHIHYQDVCAVIQQMIEMNISNQTYNVVAPQHPSKRTILTNQLQKSIQDLAVEVPKNRIISCEKLQQALSYTFTYPNPVTFPTNP